MDNEIKVSVCCLVYNHEKYLRQCLDGFMMQKTNFKFEVLIHDDASTDGSADIIREYEKKYPDIIKPIYQKENQYSKGVKVSWVYQYPRAKGKYIALCEGDDYWIDVNKLQNQVNIMENENSISLCTHSVKCVSESGETIIKMKPELIGKDKLQMSDSFVINFFLFDFYPYHTSSYMFRVSILKQMNYSIPLFISKCKVGDVPLLLLLGSKGNVYYIAENMSCYRMEAKNNWRSRQTNDKIIENLKNTISTFRLFDEYSNHKYSSYISKATLRIEFQIKRMQGLFREISKEPYRTFLKELSVKERMYIIVRGRFNKGFRLYRKLKNLRGVEF